MFVGERVRMPVPMLFSLASRARAVIVNHQTAHPGTIVPVKHMLAVSWHDGHDKRHYLVRGYEASPCLVRGPYGWEVEVEAQNQKTGQMETLTLMPLARMDLAKEADMVQTVARITGST